MTLDSAVTIWAVLISLPVGGLPVAYVLGFLPATVCGALFSALVLTMPSLLHIPRYHRGLIAAAIGAPVSAWGPALSSRNPGYDESSLSFITAGTVAAFAVGSFFPRPELLSNKSVQPTCAATRS
jgi:hypothetical protein